MREDQLLASHRKGNPHGPKAHDGKITFFAVDHCSMECVGIHVAKRGIRFEALEPIRQGMREYFGAFGKDVAAGLSLRHDHGSQYVSDVFQEEVRFLGDRVLSCLCAGTLKGMDVLKRFVRIIKENLLWVKTFETVEEVRVALQEFRRIYNETWIVGRHAYKTPAQIRREQRCLAIEAA
jgi:hypothetical protein